MLGVYSPEEFDVPKDNFSGQTIEIRPDPAQIMQPLEQTTDPEPPRRPTVTQRIGSRPWTST